MNMIENWQNCYINQLMLYEFCIISSFFEFLLIISSILYIVTLLYIVICYTKMLNTRIWKSPCYPKQNPNGPLLCYYYHIMCYASVLGSCWLPAACCLVRFRRQSWQGITGQPAEMHLVNMKCTLDFDPAGSSNFATRQLAPAMHSVAGVSLGPLGFRVKVKVKRV